MAVCKWLYYDEHNGMLVSLGLHFRPQDSSVCSIVLVSSRLSNTWLPSIYSGVLYMYILWQFSTFFTQRGIHVYVRIIPCSGIFNVVPTGFKHSLSVKWMEPTWIGQLPDCAASLLDGQIFGSHTGHITHKCCNILFQGGLHLPSLLAFFLYRRILLKAI